MRFEQLTELLPRLEEIALANFRKSDLVSDNKSAQGFDPVTIADQEIERLFRDVIGERFPSDAILGEEHQDTTGSSGFQWIIDPIDGTRAYIIGAPSFAILIALKSENGFECSVVSQPFTRERFWARQGEAFWQRGDETRKLAVSSVTDLGSAKLASTFPEIGTAAERSAFERVANQVRLTRYGLDAYAYGLLAMGQIDLVIEAGLNPFDYAAPQALIEAAGGVVTNWQGGAPEGVSTLIAASTQALADEAMALLNP